MLVPLNHRLAAAEWTAVLADCTPRLLVHDAGFAEAARALGASGRPLVVLQDTLSAADAKHKMPASTANALTEPALLVYTSGTTGTPKAAVHTQGNLLANMAMAAQVQGMTADDTVLTVLPLFHVGGLCIQTLPALSVGARVLMHTRFDPTATLRAIAQDQPSLTLQVPATLQALTAHAEWARTDLSCLRTVWAGSSVLPPEPLQAFMARGVPVSNVYGSTETGPFLDRAATRPVGVAHRLLRLAGTRRRDPAAGPARHTGRAGSGGRDLRARSQRGDDLLARQASARRRRLSSTAVTSRNRRPTAATPWSVAPRT